MICKSKNNNVYNMPFVLASIYDIHQAYAQANAFITNFTDFSHHHETSFARHSILLWSVIRLLCFVPPHSIVDLGHHCSVPSKLRLFSVGPLGESKEIKIKLHHFFSEHVFENVVWKMIGMVLVFDMVLNFDKSNADLPQWWGKSAWDLSKFNKSVQHMYAYWVFIH